MPFEPSIGGRMQPAIAGYEDEAEAMNNTHDPKAIFLLGGTDNSGRRIAARLLIGAFRRGGR
jgi:ABC-type dipeptide/oligopeptide/nickel transport system permease subunit